MKSISESIKAKMQANLANLDINLMKIEEKIMSIYNWSELNSLYEYKKKVSSKIERLKQKLKEGLQIKEKKPRLNEFKFKYWYQKYPHCNIDDSLIVIGRNAKKSESLKKKILPTTYYYHVTNRTGGSVILFTKMFTPQLHNLCKNFALVYSSYWKTPTEHPQYVTWTLGEFILLKNKSAKGQFYLKRGKNELTPSPLVSLYYLKEYNLITYTPTDVKIGEFYKSKENLYDQIYGRLTSLNILIINKVLLSLWIPEKGTLK
jgi:predicted ribosome quality control (RQC) complex YloA/Tae2 family protein